MKMLSASQPNKPLPGSRPEIPPLPAVLSRRDLVVLLLLAVMVFSNIAYIHPAGPSAISYWLLGGASFLLPCTIITRWLALRLPGQGSLYAWVSSVFGSTPGFIVTFGTWVAGLLLTATYIEEAADYLHLSYPAYLSTPTQYAFAMFLLFCLAVGISCLPLARLKHVLFVSCLLYCLLYLLLGAGALGWLLQGHQSAASFIRPVNWYAVFPNNASYFSTIIFALLGVNYPFFLGRELREGQAGLRHASTYVWWGAGLILLFYLLGTWSLVVMLPAAPKTETLIAFRASTMLFGSFGGSLFTLALACSDVILLVVYLLLFSRLLVTLAQHHHLPASFARPNRWGVPLVSLLIDALAVAVTSAVLFVLFPLLHVYEQNPAVTRYNNYELSLAIGAILLLTSMIILFVLPFFIRSYGSQQGASLGLRWRKHFTLFFIALTGISTSVIAIWAMLSISLVASMSNRNWENTLLMSVAVTLAVGWLGGEYPRLRALLSDQQFETEKERMLREQLQEAYQQQEVLLIEVDRLYREQARAAITDPVTGLPNHRSIMSTLNVVFTECGQRTCAVLFVDVDCFKRINDRWGHQVGDGILHEVGQRLRASLRADDTVGRYGGEEFAVILRDTNLDLAMSVAERLRRALEERPCCWQTEGERHETHVTISVGIALYPDHASTPDQLMKRADLAMYRAKQAGRNCVCIATA